MTASKSPPVGRGWNADMKPMMDSPDGMISVAGWSDADGADNADGVTGGATDVTSLFISVTQHKVWLPGRVAARKHC